MRDDRHALSAATQGAALISPLAVADRAAASGAALTITGNGAAREPAASVLRQVPDSGAAESPAGEGASPDAAKRQPGAAARLLLAVATLAALAAVAVTLYAVIAHPAGALQSPVWLPGRLGSWPEWAAVTAVLAALMTAAIAVRALLRATRGTAVEDVLTVAVAALVTAVCLNGMWRFFGNVLHFAAPLRVLVFGVLEGGTITCALRARRTIREHIGRIAAGEISADEPPSAGADGVAMWVFTCLSAVLASLDAGSIPAAVARLAMPLLAAWLWDRSLRLEHRRATGRTIHWAITPERILVWARLAEPTGRSTVEVDAHRYIVRVARAQHTHCTLAASGAAPWRVSRAYRVLERRLRAAVTHTRLASDLVLQDELFQRIAALGGAKGLAAAAPQAPWAARLAPDTQGEEPGAKEPRQRRRRRRQGPPPGDVDAFAELAGQLADARAEGEYGKVHDLLDGRSDHAAFVRWLAGSGQGSKRLMAVVALYATGAPACHATSVTWVATARQWIMQHIPGPAGQVDRKDIRDEGRKLMPSWTAGAAAVTGAHD